MINILCVKWGTYYGPEYVNNLYAMVKRNLSLPFRFVCLTDDTHGIHKEVEVQMLKPGLEGWWTKIAFFQSPLFDLTGPTLTIDLDMLIVDSLDDMFEYEPNQFCMKWDYAAHGHSSCVMRFNAGEHSHIYEKLDLKKMDYAPHNNKPGFKKHKYWGDQIWITEQMKGHVTLWPKSWVQKYIRDCHRHTITQKPIGEGSMRDIDVSTYEVFIPKNCKIMAFSGTKYRHETEADKISNWWHDNDLSSEYRT